MKKIDKTKLHTNKTINVFKYIVFIMFFILMGIASNEVNVKASSYIEVTKEPQFIDSNQTTVEFAMNYKMGSQWEEDKPLGRLRIRIKVQGGYDIAERDLYFQPEELPTNPNPYVVVNGAKIPLFLHSWNIKLERVKTSDKKLLWNVTITASGIYRNINYKVGALGDTGKKYLEWENFYNNHTIEFKLNDDEISSLESSL